MFLGVVLMVVGMGFLLSNLGLVHFESITQILEIWWPVILILLGLSILARNLPRR